MAEDVIVVRPVLMSRLGGALTCLFFAAWCFVLARDAVGFALPILGRVVLLLLAIPAGVSLLWVGYGALFARLELHVDHLEVRGFLRSKRLDREQLRGCDDFPAVLYEARGGGVRRLRVWPLSTPGGRSNRYGEQDRRLDAVEALRSYVDATTSQQAVEQRGPRDAGLRRERRRRA